MTVRRVLLWTKDNLSLSAYYVDCSWLGLRLCHRNYGLEIDVGKEKKKGKLRSAGLIAYQKEQNIIIRKRRHEIRQMLLQGIRSQSEMAARLGISQPAVSKHIQVIYDEWLKEDIKTTRAKIRYRVRQFEQGAQEAFVAWQKSKESEEQIITEYERKNCPECAARLENNTVDSGKKPAKNAAKTQPSKDCKISKDCKTCEGKGFILVENVTRKVTGKAGDAALLAQYNQALREAAKLEGLYIKRVKVDKPEDGGDIHLHAHGVDWSQVPAENLLRLKREYAEAAAAANPENTMDVKSEEG